MIITDNPKIKVSVLGCGRWGSFLAWYSNEIGHKVMSFGLRDTPEFMTLKQNHKNEYVTYPDEITVTDDLKKAVDFADVIIVSVPSQVLRSFMPDIVACGITGKTIVLCMKGIEIETGDRLTTVASECGVDRNQIAVWVGPGHIQEFVKHNPNCMIVDSYSHATTDYIIERFKSSLIRFYYGDDIVGTEIGAAAKNVMGIVAGVLDGLNLATLKGALMARGSREVARYIEASGGNPLSAYGLCHLGDYETTLFSEHSHNRKWGENYVIGKPFHKLAEGVYTARAMANVAERLRVDMPITKAVNSLVTERTPPMEVLEALFSRNLKRDLM